MQTTLLSSTVPSPLNEFIFKSLFYASIRLMWVYEQVLNCHYEEVRIAPFQWNILIYMNSNDLDPDNDLNIFPLPL